MFSITVFIVISFFLGFSFYKDWKDPFYNVKGANWLIAFAIWVALGVYIFGIVLEGSNP